MPSILLVEDDATMLSLLIMLLEMENFTVITLPEDTPKTILATIQAEKPDLLLMDVNLRQASGMEVLKMIKANETNKGMRILMSSGMDFRVECLKAGADGFILKPYMPDDLIRQIHQVLAAVR